MPTDHAATNPCSNCGDPVRQRRPSATGEHWCKRPGCQAAKQRRHRARKDTTSKLEVLEKLKLGLFAAVAHRPRVTCEECGRTDAVPDFVHATPTWTGVCFGTGGAGNEPELTPWYVALWPEGAPRFTDPA